MKTCLSFGSALLASMALQSCVIVSERPADTSPPPAPPPNAAPLATSETPSPAPTETAAPATPPSPAPSEPENTAAPSAPPPKPALKSREHDGSP